MNGRTAAMPVRPVMLSDENLVPASTPGGVSIGSFSGFDDDGHFLVRIERHEPMRALSTVRLGAEDEGAPVAVAYENGGQGRLVIVGRAQARVAGPDAASRTAVVDGERVVMQADRELELRCGDASIVLTRAGKVLIKGNFVLTRSRGANKIKGAYVDIN